MQSETEVGGGSEVDSNFHQLMLLRAKDDPQILEVMSQKTRKVAQNHSLGASAYHSVKHQNIRLFCTGIR